MSTKKINEPVFSKADKKYGLVVKSTGGLYSVEEQNGHITKCRAKGSFRHDRISPLAGDKVEFVLQSDGSGFITDISQRKNSYFTKIIPQFCKFTRLMPLCNTPLS